MGRCSGRARSSSPDPEPFRTAASAGRHRSSCEASGAGRHPSARALFVGLDCAFDARCRPWDTADEESERQREVGQGIESGRDGDAACSKRGHVVEVSNFDANDADAARLESVFEDAALLEPLAAGDEHGLAGRRPRHRVVGRLDTAATGQRPPGGLVSGTVTSPLTVSSRTARKPRSVSGLSGSRIWRRRHRPPIAPRRPPGTGACRRRPGRDWPKAAPPPPAAPAGEKPKVRRPIPRR